MRAGRRIRARLLAGRPHPHVNIYRLTDGVACKGTAQGKKTGVDGERIGAVTALEVSSEGQTTPPPPNQHHRRM
jgi:hypothetical protein